MGLRNYLTVSSLLLLTLLLSNCGFIRKPEKEIVVQTVEVQKVIPVQPQPKPVDMTDVKFYVVTEENYEEFKEKFMKTNNDFVFYVVSVHDYENLALNMSELFRYIKQQKEIVKGLTKTPAKELAKKFALRSIPVVGSFIAAFSSTPAGQGSARFGPGSKKNK